MTRLLVVEPGYCPYQAGFPSAIAAASEVIEGESQILKPFGTPRIGLIYWAVQENINAIRAAAGLSPLAMDGGLSAAADARCESFVAGGAFDHSGMTTRSEICAAGPIGSASSVCSYWQNSPAHYANITNASFTSMGVACWFCSTAEGQYTYWTVTFN